MGPLPGIEIDVVNGEGESVGEVGGGYLTLNEPWPAMLRGIWNDEERYRETYWSKFGDRYFAGDGAKWDDEHVLWLLGRVDDVMLVSGHNISTTEVESALVSHPKVAESAVVGATDPTTGQAIVAFVIPRGSTDIAGDAGEALIQELRDHVSKTLGPIAKPRQIMLVAELPKTRSGKIMRRLLRDVAENRSLGDVTTLQDSTVMDLISAGMAKGATD
jgi:acetyl-CoA synthetase